MSTRAQPTITPMQPIVTTAITPTKGHKTLHVSTQITEAAAGNPVAYRSLSLAEQQAKLLEHLPLAMDLLKASLLAMMPQFGLEERIGWVGELWDGVVAGVEVVVDWGTGTIQAVAVGITITF